VKIEHACNATELRVFGIAGGDQATYEAKRRFGNRGQGFDVHTLHKTDLYLCNILL